MAVGVGDHGGYTERNGRFRVRSVLSLEVSRMDMRDLTVTEEAENGFFPTPPEVAELLLADLDWCYIYDVLEPSAGKGNLVFAVAQKYWELHGNKWGDISTRVNVECIEFDPYLRTVLQYEFGGQRLDELWDAVPRDQRGYELKLKYPELAKEIHPRRAINFRIVHDDFLTCDTRKAYHLIVMNPPFSNGDAHLLKAIQMQERYGGMIRCILNAETLLNPYTNQRKVLKKKLEQYEAEVSFHDNAFSHAERKTDARIAIIKINIPVPKHDSTIYDRLKKAAEVNSVPVGEVHDLTIADFMTQIITNYNVEVDAGLELIREYEALKPYILTSMQTTGNTPSSILSLSVSGSKSYYLSTNDYVKAVRRKYWEALFTNKKFVGTLTTNIRDKYYQMVDKMQEYDFTLYNIQQIAAEMNAEMCKGIQDTIVALFDRMTVEHSWYPECSQNVHYFNGWKTNQAHKIGMKVILPVNDMFSVYSWERDKLNARNAENTISDIEKVFDYLDGNMTAPVDLHSVIDSAVQTGTTKNMQCKYFTLTVYKKGTMHLKFNNQKLVDRFNIYCCQKKGWLPPSYGKASYTDMDQESRAVVDGFDGDGSKGSGEKAYTEIMAHADYYLSAPTQQRLALGAGV